MKLVALLLVGQQLRILAVGLVFVAAHAGLRARGFIAPLLLLASIWALVRGWH